MADLISTNPCTGIELWRGPIADEAAVDAAVQRARAAQPAWEATPLDDRIAILRAYADRVKARADDVARIISQETGKPFWETKTEAASVAAKVDISIKAQAERTGAHLTDTNGLIQALRHRAHGVLAVLGPYNFPAHLPNGHIVPALLAGNAVVFKPSELAPATAELTGTLWREAGLPDGVLEIVQGDGETGKALAGHAGTDGLLFTGSSGTGKALARQFAETPGRILALEMGGNNPLLVWDLADGDLDAATAIIVQSAFLSAGQRCTCARRLIVQDRLANTLLARIAETIDTLIVGAPFDQPQPFMGPVVDNRAADKVQAQVAALLALGGGAIRPLVRRDPALPFLSPALIDMSGLENAPDEEIFGPVLQIWRESDFDVAIARANATRFGLSAAMLGGTRDQFDRFRQRTRAGVINWNRPTNGASSALPFGGLGDSGNHRPSAYYAADYCAFPVAGMEAPVIEGALGVGVRA
ncbi:succinylglutamate-semialdehyde dehydrogenase [Sphingobium nicotianae]|uniref:Succinylglutamate-semialdehyde dehydrogenase n=1 Tax=Sphingobium nicotianae TaxID=2782607 RepID=A0A9X1IS92_9SPHN|nr:succinylglutamate-semialdehyde dehydrogenase [Sphingobium nicotianae]MBT2188203.1 succinylglutamate-semialdehyde dehydrogenase [Sphingobium nicotianae]